MHRRFLCLTAVLWSCWCSAGCLVAGCFVQEPGSSPACACPLVRKAWKPDVAQLLEVQGGFIWGWLGAQLSGRNGDSALKTRGQNSLWLWHMRTGLQQVLTHCGYFLRVSFSPFLQLGFPWSCTLTCGQPAKAGSSLQLSPG